MYTDLHIHLYETTQNRTQKASEVLATEMLEELRVLRRDLYPGPKADRPIDRRTEATKATAAEAAAEAAEATTAAAAPAVAPPPAPAPAQAADMGIYICSQRQPQAEERPP